MTFRDQVAIVTGGGTGIGRATAAALLARGAAVVLVGRREEVLTRAARELDARGERVLAVAGDVGVRATSARAVALAKERFGGVDLLLNAAGIFRPTPFLDHGEAELDAYLGAILKGTFYTSQAAVPALEARGGGAIVNVGSMWGLQAVAATPSAAYSAAKAGVHALSKNLALELAPLKIRVNAVAPAVVETPVYRTFLPEERVKSVLAGFNAFHPLGRIGQPEDLVHAILFLLSREAAWITGVVLPVDGGVMAGRS
jgi:NAD(P)-dependent dehydrogenase (short-subunit alcohol dehydrogenase family)